MYERSIISSSWSLCTSRGDDPRLGVMIVFFPGHVAFADAAVDAILKDENKGKVLKDRFYPIDKDSCYWPETADK